MFEFSGDNFLTLWTHTVYILTVHAVLRLMTYIHTYIYSFMRICCSFSIYIHTIQTTDRIEMSDIRVFEVTVNTVHPPPVSMHIAYCHQWILHRTTMFSLFPFLCETSHTPYVQQQPRGYIHTGGKTLLLDYSTTSPDRIRTLDWS
jgi:hypothetical protein